MEKIIIKIYQLLFCLSLSEYFLIPKSSNAFLPKIYEPSKQELKSTSIQITKTAIQLIEFGQIDDAIKLLELAVKLNPKEQNIYFTKASIYMDMNNLQKAKVTIKKGLSINEKNERGHFQLGNVEIMLNNYKSAIRAFRRSSQINTSFWQSINNEGLILYELNKPKEAISKFQIALEISNNAEPMLALAIVLFSIDNKSIESIKLAKNALRLDPQYISKKYQSKQLWGKKLQKSAQLLFISKEMKKIVMKAQEISQ